MTFQIPDGTLLWNFVQPTRRQFRNLFEWCFFFIPFLESCFCTEYSYITLQCVCKYSKHRFDWTKQYYFICNTLSPWYGILSLQNAHPAEIPSFYQYSIWFYLLCSVLSSFLHDRFFCCVVGIWRGVILTISTFFKVKNDILFIL